MTTTIDRLERISDYFERRGMELTLAYRCAAFDCRNAPEWAVFLDPDSESCFYYCEPHLEHLRQTGKVS